MFSKFPFRVTLLLCLVLLFTVWNLLRAWTALTWRNTLSEFSAQPAAWIIILSGMFWALTGILLIGGTWQKKPWAKKFLLGATTGYTVWYWGGQLIWQMPRPNWQFAVILNLLLVIFIMYTTKSPTREAYERES
jgi:hypothetical protein